MGTNLTLMVMRMRFWLMACLTAIMVVAFTSVALPAAAQDAPPAAATPPAAAPQAPPTIIRSINVVGTQRIEPNTVASYLLFAPGDPYSEVRIDSSIKTLFQTGLFADVAIDPRDGNVLIQVVENPIINRVILEGNKNLKADKITDEIDAEPRAIFTRSSVEEDVTRIIELYRQAGRFAATVEPKVVQQPQNRIDLIFEITEGPVTGVRRINFIGNAEYPDRRLRKEIVTDQSAWYKIFSSNDNYDPGRLEFDREQLRTFYTDRGFADFRVVSAVAELTPDQEDFYITFTMDEGAEYRWGEVTVDADLDGLDTALLEAALPIKSGDIYNASKVEDAIDNLNFFTGTAGYAFVDIQPRPRNNRADKTVDIVFNIVEGPRTYVERIDIVGNVTTLDYVIRRQLELVEGDAFNRVLLNASRNRVRQLRFFEDVEITETIGSAPDKAIVEVKVTEQPTGELSFSAGFSSRDAFLLDFSISQRNLRGRGQSLGLSVAFSQNRRNVNLSFGEPRFLGRELSASVSLFDSEIDFIQEAGFRQSSTGGQVALGFRLTENTFFTANYSLRQQELNFPQEAQCDAILGAAGSGGPVAAQNIQLLSLCEQANGRLSSILGYNFTWNNKNDPITPTRGFDFTFGQQLAGIGGDVRYLRTDAEANFYRGLYPGVISSLRLLGGYIRGWGGDSVTVNDRFFKGSFDFRGFDNAGIGPRTLTFNADTGDTLVNGIDGRGQALGGNIFGLATAEVSFPVGVPQLTGSLWAEAGTVGFLDEDQTFNIILDPGTSGLTAGESCEGVTLSGVICQRTADDLSLRSIIGASVFWESPFGPIRFDFTKPIREVAFDDRQSFQFTTRTRF